LTLREWKTLSKSEKTEYVDNNNPDFKVSLDLPKKDQIYNLQSYEKFQSRIPFIVKKMENYETELDTEIDDYSFATVGPVVRTLEVYLSTDHHFLAGRISFYQQGCSHVDEENEHIDESGHYSNWEEAGINKCVDNDVSWEASSVMNELFKELEHDEYMEWTGH
jgi:hypothetical protein